MMIPEFRYTPVQRATLAMTVPFPEQFYYRPSRGLFDIDQPDTSSHDRNPGNRPNLLYAWFLPCCAPLVHDKESYVAQQLELIATRCLAAETASIPSGRSEEVHASELVKQARKLLRMLKQKDADGTMAGENFLGFSRDRLFPISFSSLFDEPDAAPRTVDPDWLKCPIDKLCCFLEEIISKEGAVISRIADILTGTDFHAKVIDQPAIYRRGIVAEMRNKGSGIPTMLKALSDLEGNKIVTLRKDTNTAAT